MTETACFGPYHVSLENTLSFEKDLLKVNEPDIELYLKTMGQRFVWKVTQNKIKNGIVSAIE